jgi:hypothetical protein
MAHPTTQPATLRPELSTFEELDREMQLRGYVGTRIMPAFQVGVAAGTFSVIALKSLLANADASTKRTSTGGYNRGDYKWEPRAYQTQENGWEEPVDEREAAMYANFYDYEEIAAYRAWEHVLNSLEARVIAKAITATVTASQTNAASAVWSTLASSKPIDDVGVAQEAIWARTGQWPDTLVVSRRAWRNLRQSAQIVAAIQAQGAGQSAIQSRVTTEMVAECLDLRQIVVADSIKNTANSGQSATLASVFPETQALVCKTATTNDFKEPCLGRIFHWGGDGSRIQGENLIGVVERYSEPQTRKDIVRVRHETDEFLLYPEMAQVITGVRS